MEHVLLLFHAFSHGSSIRDPDGVFSKLNLLHLQVSVVI